VVNLWQTEKASIRLDIIEGKIKQEEKSLSCLARGKQLMSWTIFLLLQPKWKLQTLLESFKRIKKEF
jgi:hypothetical protein